NIVLSAMPEVRIERLCTGRAEKHCPKNPEPLWVMNEELVRVNRVNCPKHVRMLEKIYEPNRPEHEEPNEHDRPERFPHAARAVMLHRKEYGDDEERNG